jgi:serine/threonine-protein kinase
MTVESPDGAKVIAGRYELQSLIGEGGMASVWRAHDLTLERQVAVKILFARDERDREKLVKQFVREARIAASVQHRNVIHIVDFGTTEDQRPYMVMELLEGESLGQRMHREPPLGVEEVVHIASLTLRGLAAVHSAGIVHRDLKPDNVFLVRDASAGLFPKILDFGISRSVEPRSGRRSALTTQEGIIVGTPEYMSPEQARGLRNLDHRTDVYSMGVILYEALTGRLPFNNEHVGDLIIQIVTAQVPPVHELAPHVPRAISDVVANAMSREREARFADAVEMQRALLTAAQEAFPGMQRVTLSDLPVVLHDPVSGTLPRVSLERLRTLEFPLDAPSESANAQEPEVTRSPPPAPNRSSAPPRASSAIAKARWLKPLLAASAALALLGGWVSLRGGQSVPDEVRATPIAVATPVVPAPPATTTVLLRQVPEGARIELDGAPVQGPSLELPRDARARHIRVIAQGSEPWQITHVASSDGAYDVVLTPAPRAASTTLSAASPRKSAAARKRPAATSSGKKPASTAQQQPPSALRQLDF